MNLKEIAKQIIEENYIVGVRAVQEDEDYQVGDICRDSYEWDIETDTSTYETTGELAIGTCATRVETDSFDTDDWETELENRLKEVIAENKLYGDKQVIIAGSQVNNDGCFDPGEIRIIDAEVIAIVE